MVASLRAFVLRRRAHLPLAGCVPATHVENGHYPSTSSTPAEMGARHLFAVRLKPLELLPSPTKEPRAEVQLAKLGTGQDHAEACRNQSGNMPEDQQNRHSGADRRDH